MKINTKTNKLTASLCTTLFYVMHPSFVSILKLTDKIQQLVYYYTLPKRTSSYNKKVL